MSETRQAVVRLFLPVAQLDSALDSDSKGQRFESARAGQKEAAISDRKWLLFF